jgi:TolA-binding protein
MADAIKQAGIENLPLPWGNATREVPATPTTQPAPQNQQTQPDQQTIPQGKNDKQQTVQQLSQQIDQLEATLINEDQITQSSEMDQQRQQLDHLLKVQGQMLSSDIENIVKTQCGGALYNTTPIELSNSNGLSNINLSSIQEEQATVSDFTPYAIQGKCFYESVKVDQWINQNMGLVNTTAYYGQSAPFAVDFPTPPQGNSVNAILGGEAPFQYNAADGTEMTVPRFVVLYSW